MHRLLLALTCLLAAVGCGSEDEPVTTLDEAAQKTLTAGSNRQEFSMAYDIEGEKFLMNGEGTVSADAAQARMTFDADVNGEKASFEAIADGRDIYLKNNGLPLPPGKEWLRTTEMMNSTLSPREFVDILRASGEVVHEGTEQIRGQPTTHYRGSVSVREFAEASRSEFLRRLNQAPEVDALDASVDVWVRNDGLPARVALEVRPPQTRSLGA